MPTLEQHQSSSIMSFSLFLHKYHTGIIVSKRMILSLFASLKELCFLLQSVQVNNTPADCADSHIFNHNKLCDLMQILFNSPEKNWSEYENLAWNKISNKTLNNQLKTTQTTIYKWCDCFVDVNSPQDVVGSGYQVEKSSLELHTMGRKRFHVLSFEFMYGAVKYRVDTDQNKDKTKVHTLFGSRGAAFMFVPLPLVVSTNPPVFIPIPSYLRAPIAA